MTDLIWLYTSKILSMALGLVVAVFYYNYLGPEKIGILAFISILLLYFGLLSNDISIHNIAIRHERETENKNSFFSAAFILKIFISFIFFCAFVAYVSFSNIGEKLIAYILGMALLFSPLLVFNSVLEYEQKFRLIAKIDLITTWLNYSVIFMLVYLKSELLGFVIVQTFFIMIKNIIFAFFSFKNGFKLNFSNLYSNIRILLNGYWPLFIGAIMVSLYMRVDQIMIKYYKGLYYLGIYVLVVNLIEKLNFIPTTLVSYLYPRYAKLKTRDEFVNLTSKIANVILPFMALSVLFCIFFAQDIARFFAKSYPVDIFTKTFIALSFSFIGVFSGSIFARVDILFDMQKQQTIMLGIMLLINIVLNFLLIPQYHIIGAAIATSVSYCLVTILPYFLMPKMRLIYKLLLKKYLIFWPSMAFITILFLIYGNIQSFVFRVLIYIFISAILFYMNKEAFIFIFPRLKLKKEYQNVK